MHETLGEVEIMANTPLERRVTALEQQVAELSSQKLNGYDAKPWLALAGIFAGDEGMKEIFDEALKLGERIVNSPAVAPRKPPHAEPNSDRLGHRSFVGLCLPRNAGYQSLSCASVVHRTSLPLPSFAWKSNYAVGSPRSSENAIPATKFPFIIDWDACGSSSVPGKSCISTTVRPTLQDTSQAKGSGSALSSS